MSCAPRTGRFLFDRAAIFLMQRGGGGGIIMNYDKVLRRTFYVNVFRARSLGRTA